MTDWDKIIKEFDIPNIEDISLKDSILINEAINSQNMMYVFALILRLLGNTRDLNNTVISLSNENKALIAVNDNLISAIKNHEERMSDLEKRLEDIFIVDKGGKHTH